MPSSLTIRQVCSRRLRAGQLEDLVSFLALLGFAVGNFCRRDRDFRETRDDQPRRAGRLLHGLIQTRVKHDTAYSAPAPTSPTAARKSNSIASGAAVGWSQGVARALAAPAPDLIARGVSLCT